MIQAASKKVNRSARSLASALEDEYDSGCRLRHEGRFHPN
jgi:hypothetical protein